MRKYAEYLDLVKAQDAYDVASRLLLSSDIHTSGLSSIKPRKDTEIVVIAGDFMGAGMDSVDAGRKWLDDVFCKWAEGLKANGIEIVLIPGNHDKHLWRAWHDDEEVSEKGFPSNCHYLIDCGCTVKGLKFYGMPWCENDRPHRFECGAEDMARYCAKIPSGIDVLVTHCPPAIPGEDIDVHDGIHHGSVAIAEAILRAKPKICVCGHVHGGSRDKVKLGDTVVMNVARVKGDRSKGEVAPRAVNLESIAMDAISEYIDSKPDRHLSICHDSANMEEHDKAYHKGKYDPETMRCSLRDNDKVDADVESPNPDKHDLAMTPDMCRKMIRRAFAVGGIREYCGYSTPEEWFEKDGPHSVAMIVDNTRSLYDQFVSPIADDIDCIEDVLKSYKRGTLVGPRENSKSGSDAQVGKMDISHADKIGDTRFYSNERSELRFGDWAFANSKATGPAKEDVEKARGRILIYAHNKGALDKIGVTQKELNSRLRAWSAYPSSAMKLSQRLNDGVGESAQWTGIENMSCLSEYLARKQDVKSLVKSVSGEPDDFQCNYITRTMLALDTHIDYRKLSFEFTRDRISGGSHDNCNGTYSSSGRKIVCKINAPHTVAHEIGHYLDDQWGRELGYSDYLSDKPMKQIDPAYHNTDPDVVKFIGHFDRLMDSLDSVADERSGYTLDRKEIFARFVSKFVQWTEKQAKGSRAYFRGEDYSDYNDRFNSGQYIEFVRILQEKAWLDANGKTKKGI